MHGDDERRNQPRQARDAQDGQGDPKPSPALSPGSALGPAPAAPALGPLSPPTRSTPRRRRHSAVGSAATTVIDIAANPPTAAGTTASASQPDPGARPISPAQFAQHPRQARVAEQHCPLPHDQPLGDERVPRVQDPPGQPGQHGQPRLVIAPTPPLREQCRRPGARKHKNGKQDQFLNKLRRENSRH